MRLSEPTDRGPRPAPMILPRRAAAVLVALAAALALAGCMTDRAPRFDTGPDGEPVQFKRYESNLSLDWINHQTRALYQLVEAGPYEPTLSPAQRELLMNEGRPDYIRREFRSETDELVKEWIYWKKEKIVQFVAGELVFEGPLTDYERILIRRGRPDKHFSQAADNFAPRVDILHYNGVFNTKLDIYRFSDGKQIIGLIN